MEELKVNYELSELVRSVISMDENSIKKLIQLLVASSPESSFIPLLKSFREMQNLSSLNQEVRYTGSLLYQAALITSILFDYNYIIRDPKVDMRFLKNTSMNSVDIPRLRNSFRRSLVKMRVC
ncbi:MAG: hypothetical protein QXD03_00180 [Candidatus Anstonellales archaeon]